MVAYVAFEDADIKVRVERFLRSITNSMEMVLRRNVEVRIIHLPNGEGENQVNLPGLKQAESTVAGEREISLNPWTQLGPHHSVAVLDSSQVSTDSMIQGNPFQLPVTRQFPASVHE